jgi:hypothetical protein
MMKIPPTKKASFNWRILSLAKVAKYVSFVVGAVILICVLIIVFFPDPFINTFLKDRITKAFTEAYPAYSVQLGDMHCNVWKNRLGCDSITLKTREFTCSAASFSVSGIGWMDILRQRDFTPHTLTSSVIDAHKIVLIFRQSQNVLRFGMLHISVPDSEMVTESIKYYSLLHDEQFFANSQFRQTRFRFDIPQIKIMGLDCLALLQGNTYKATDAERSSIFDEGNS